MYEGTTPVSESCRRYGISRTAGYTWWTRFLAEGFEGLHDRSHRPHHCPHAVAEPIVEHVVDLRQRYGWGSRKIRKLTAEKFGGAPARRTIDRIFERHDLITKKRRRSGKPGHPGKRSRPWMSPTRSGPSTSKGSSRCSILLSPHPGRLQSISCSSEGVVFQSIELAKPVFINVFREFGLPAVIRSDNGTPFASIGLARSAWWIRLGPETIGKPQQNGRHERMHRTLKREATQPPKANLSAQQRHFNDFRRTFNHMLDDATPHSVYRRLLPFPLRCPRSSRSSAPHHLYPVARGNQLLPPSPTTTRRSPARSPVSITTSLPWDGPWDGPKVTDRDSTTSTPP